MGVFNKNLHCFLEFPPAWMLISSRLAEGCPRGVSFGKLNTQQEILVAVDEHLIKVGKLEWFYREALPVHETDKPPVILLHGLPSQSYSWREILPVLANQGLRAIAPDWIGFGSSSKPDPFDFAYTPDAFREAFSAFLEALEISQYSLIIQGFLGTVGIQYALQNPDHCDRLVILNAPIFPEAKLPWKIQQLGLPFIGDMMTQDPLTIDRTLEGGGPYQVADKDLTVYRSPFLKSSSAGRSLLATVRNLKIKQVASEMSASLAQNWTKPTLVVWGVSDPWLPVSLAEAYVRSLKNVEFIQLAEVGHYPQEDWHEKVSEAVLPFLRRQTV